MATIGLDRLYYSKITEDANGEETYATPSVLAKAITAELSVELVEAILYADDGAAEVVKDFNSGTLTLEVDDIGSTVAADLTGASTDDNGVLISASENVGTPVAVGFRAKNANGTYRYFWLYRICSVCLRQTYRQRLIPSLFLLLLLRGLLCEGTSWTA
jgi:phi13 family phage major tail protein